MGTLGAAWRIIRPQKTAHARLSPAPVLLQSRTPPGYYIYIWNFCHIKFKEKKYTHKKKEILGSAFRICEIICAPFIPGSNYSQFIIVCVYKMVATACMCRCIVKVEDRHIEAVVTMGLYQRRKCSLVKKEGNPLYSAQKALCSTVWTKFETFDFQLFC